ncbi:Fc.00g009220.m01.CDS01 [Cosmosporella sp. VM-42]
MASFLQSFNPFARKDKPVMTVASTNKQWTTTFNGLDKLQFTEAEVPKPKDGEVLVKICAVSLNYRDTKVVIDPHDGPKSLEKAEALVPCSDMCGIVVESKSPKLKAGTRVMSIFNQSHLTGQIQEKDMATGLGLPLPGVLTEYRCFVAESLVLVPDYMTDEEASTLPISAVTAWMCINGMRPMGSPADGSKNKESVLLQGTGGVSVAGLQIARACGLETIITSSADTTLERAKKDLGADHTINSRTHWEWQDPVKDKTNGGADIIFETGSTRTLRKSFECVRFGGLINCVDYMTGKEDTPERTQMNINVLVLRRNVTLQAVLNGPKDRFEEMLEFYKKHQIRPVVDKVFAFDKADEAFKYLVSGEHFGKVVIKVANE